MKQVNNYSWTNKAGMQIDVRTEKYGVAGFDVYVTVKNLGIENKQGNLFKNTKGEWLIALGEYKGRALMVMPTDEVLNKMLADKNTPTEERKAYYAAERERKRKEREFDNLYNEGAEGYNPYRRDITDNDNTPYYKGDKNE